MTDTSGQAKRAASAPSMPQRRPPPPVCRAARVDGFTPLLADLDLANAPAGRTQPGTWPIHSQPHREPWRGPPVTSHHRAAAPWRHRAEKEEEQS
ncbi:hypothetical protein [Micromonospora sp. NPDC050200]|uniref:hypothetical protein n=1 Tax=Micromonospora sp. NPDC050200 TaxID=3155664 RepID=UPI0033C06C47